LCVRPPSRTCLRTSAKRNLRGESEQIKEYSIALDVFGRPDSFDQDTDSIVRVQANRLRKRLAEYYSNEGGHDPLRIAIPIGQYYSDDSRWWGPDNYFKGGQLGSSDQPATDADDPDMFETERWGHFSYAIPAAPGRYTATFYFIERRFDAANRDRYGEIPDGQGTAGRLFSVYCNGKAILRDLDLIKLAGENHALTRRVSELEPNAQGKLLLEFAPTRNYATVTAIEVVPQND